MLPLIQRVLAIVGELLGIAQQLLGITSTAAQEHAKYAIETIASNGTNTVIHPTYGNAALKAILDQIVAAVNTANNTVYIQPTPPSAYVAPTTSAITSAVWGYQSDYYTTGLHKYAVSTIDLLANVWSYLASEMNELGWPDARTDSYRFACRNLNNWQYMHLTFYDDGAPVATPTEPDWSQWVDGDTPYSFLARTQAGYGWSSTDINGQSASGVAWKVSGSGQNTWAWRSAFMGPPALSGAPTTIAAGPPVWPGVANVTLGTPVSIANGASSAEVCDGVIVAITAVPTGQGSYTFDTHESYVHLGQLAFVDDNGEYEDGQNFGFEAGIITPKRMAHAAGFVMRVKSGVTGTVTPWSTA
jgi:hypothetical protein